MIKTVHAEEIRVGIGEYGIACNPHRLLTLGLGSCIGVALYDPVSRVGGLAHVMLPDSTMFRTAATAKPAKFADLGVKVLWRDLRSAGARNGRVVAKLAGGAQMFFGNSRAVQMAVGERNIETVHAVLKKLGIEVLAQDIGGNKGRTVILDTSDGSFIVRTLGMPEQVI